jgi:hypothetical protein
MRQNAAILNRATRMNHVATGQIKKSEAGAE